MTDSSRFKASNIVRRLGEKSLKQVQATADVWVVTDTDGGIVRARPTIYPEAQPQRVSVLIGVRCLLGDEILVTKVAGRWFAIGSIRSDQNTFSQLQSAPVVSESLVRVASDQPSNEWVSTTDFASLRTTIGGLDPGMTYLVEAEAGAYLTSAAITTKVAMGVRIGFASDPESIGSPEWGAGHQSTTPLWARAKLQRIVSSVTSMQVTGRGMATATGSHTIGDGEVNVTITPLFTTGRI